MATSRATAKEKEAKLKRFLFQDSISLWLNLMYDPQLQLSLNQFLSMVQTLKKKICCEHCQMRCALRGHFSDCGEITRISLPCDQETGATRGLVTLFFGE